MADDFASPADREENGDLRSRLYGDLYFSRQGGLAEARAVFLEGCGLPRAWSGRDHFCVAELGFGTGLNIVALLDLWRRAGPPGARLQVFSIEAHPLAAAQARGVLAAWPEVDEVAGLLLDRWPGQARGFHRVDLPELNATVDVAVMDAAAALRAWSGRADAWFLDGFAPALNPGMWRQEVLDLVAARSASGARGATYTVAGAVRRGLAQAGFSVDRKPGFGRKRERLEARWPGSPASAAPRPTVAIIGAGIAGAALARGFGALGVEARILEAEAVGSGASGGPAALVAPRLDAGLGAHASLFAQAIARADALYDRLGGAVISRGAVQLEIGVKDAARFAAISGSDLFEPGAVARLGPDETAARLGEAAPAGLAIKGARVVAPLAILGAWLGPVTIGPIARLEPIAGGWRLLDRAGDTVVEAQVVCLAAGIGCARLAPGLPLTPVRGQSTWMDCGFSMGAVLFGGYAIPTRDGIVFGATHDRGETDASPRADDHVRNRATLAAALPGLAARLEGETAQAHTGVRATTSDFLPLAGAIHDAPAGLFVLSGLGSRGFTLAPLLGEHVAARALGLPSPLPNDLAALVDPGRFAARQRRRAGRAPLGTGLRQ